MRFRVMTDHGNSRHLFNTPAAAHAWAALAGVSTLPGYRVEGLDDHGSCYTESGVMLPENSEKSRSV